MQYGSLRKALIIVRPRSKNNCHVQPVPHPVLITKKPPEPDRRVQETAEDVLPFHENQTNGIKLLANNWCDHHVIKVLLAEILLMQTLD